MSGFLIDWIDEAVLVSYIEDLCAWSAFNFIGKILVGSNVVSVVIDVLTAAWADGYVPSLLDHACVVAVASECIDVDNAGGATVVEGSMDPECVAVRVTCLCPGAGLVLPYIGG